MLFYRLVFACELGLYYVVRLLLKPSSRPSALLQLHKQVGHGKWRAYG
jgi:hypothetical protein